LNEGIVLLYCGYIPVEFVRVALLDGSVAGVGVGVSVLLAEVVVDVALISVMLVNVEFRL
jgi:hypothetical protein